MATNFKSYLRLEPLPYERNLEAGFSAAIHDPIWFLARQWQMGEHQGENATTPVWVNYNLRSNPVQSSDLHFDPLMIPAEAIVESEIGDWWTMGRRIRIGKQFANLPAVQGDPNLLFDKPPPPYEHFHRQPDGYSIWIMRETLGITDEAFGGIIPPESISAWNSEQLLYQQTQANSFATNHHTLTVQRHRGGRMDWYSVDACPGESTSDAPSEPREGIPTALQYPGAPNSRWWQIEDSEVDSGGYVPDSAHTPTALLTELIFSHSDDWFLFPVMARAGHVVAVEKLEVFDSFDRSYSSENTTGTGQKLYPGLHPPEEWTLFQVDGLKPEELLLWHVAELPLESIPIERVQFGPDEESNLFWAVERTLRSCDVGSVKVDLMGDVTKNPIFNSGQPSGDARKKQAKEFAYVPAQGIVPFWHPYAIHESEGKRWLRQCSLLDLSRQQPTLMPKPKAKVLQSNTDGELHRISPSAIPSSGIELERKWHLARDMHGNPVLWIQRQRLPLLSPPARRLRFDVLEEANFE